MASGGTGSALAPAPIGTYIQKGFSLYLSRVGWFAGAGLLLAGIQALALAASAGWAVILGQVLLTPAVFGLIAVADAVERGQDPDMGHLLSGFKNGRTYALGVLTTALMVGGLLLAVVPGLIAIVGLVWSIVALQQRPVGALQAAQLSFALARDNIGLTLLIMLVGIVLNSLSTGTIVLGAFCLPLAVCIKLIAFQHIAPRG